VIGVGLRTIDEIIEDSVYRQLVWNFAVKGSREIDW